MKPTRNVVRWRGLALCCVPKCANTALKWAVLEAEGIPVAARAHRHPRLRLGHPEQAVGLYTAAFLRHPCARLVSLWADKIARDAGPATRALEDAGFRVGMTFRAFAERAVARRYGDVHLRPQTDFLAPRMHFLGRVERLGEDWARLQQRFPALPDLGRHNVAAGDDWQRYCRGDLRMAIERHYVADLAVWSEAKGDVIP